MYSGFRGISSLELQAAASCSREGNPKPRHHEKPQNSSLISTKARPKGRLPDDGRPRVAVRFTRASVFPAQNKILLRMFFCKILFLERKEGKGKERERSIDVTEKY